MPILDTILNAVKVTATEKLGESAIESIAKHTSNVVMHHMDKNNVKFVYTPQSAESYREMTFDEVYEELTAYGFTNINLLEKKTLKNNWFNRNKFMKVSEISINGKTEFKKKAKFLSDAHIVITYCTYKD